MRELARLRELLQLPVDDSWTPVGARVLAAHLGPNSMLDSITINRGYATGASPGTPIVTHKGLVGRVLRASPHTSTALLLTNPGSRIAVFSQESRSPGVLTGEGATKPLAVRYMQRATKKVFSQYEGLTVDEALKLKPDVATGATYTSEALIQNIQAGLRQAQGGTKASKKSSGKKRRK